MKTSNQIQVRNFANSLPSTIQETKLCALVRLINAKGEPIDTEDKSLNGVKALKFSESEYIALKIVGKLGVTACAITAYYMTDPYSFEVAVNPFTHEATIKQADQEISMFYKEVDEWNSFKMNGKVFDIHFDYDENFTVSIYPVENGQTVDISCKVNLKIILSDGEKPRNG